MTITNSADRERQRFEHLVLGRSRPRTAPSRRTKRATPVQLAPGIEEQVALREKWSHKQGTAETHENYERQSNRPGALARLWSTGAITDDQMDAADRIAAVFWKIARDVAVRTASYETRIAASREGRVEGERLGAVAGELAYSAWRRAVGAHGEALLEVIVHDVPLTIAARGAGMGMARARRVLTTSLDLWWQASGEARREAKAALDRVTP